MPRTPGPAHLQTADWNAIYHFLRWRGHSDAAARAKLQQYQQEILDGKVVKPS